MQQICALLLLCGLCWADKGPPVLPAPIAAGPANPKSAAALQSPQDQPSGRVIGRLGKIIAQNAQVMFTNQKKQLVAAGIAKGSYVAVTGEKQVWYQVLTASGVSGWINKDAVQLENYNVVQRTPGSAPGAVTTGVTGGGNGSVLKEAGQFLGVPYKWGGASIRATDCSGYVQQVFREMGVKLPRTAREQAQIGKKVDWKDLRPGDRLYFNTKGRAVDHCGIYIGSDLFVHASGAKGAVVVDALSTPKYANSLVLARRDG